MFNTAAGIASAAFLSIQYSGLFWSQQIRPYAFGLFFCTGLLWIFSQLVFAKQRNKKQYLLLILFAVGAAYTHYFSGLFACPILLVLFWFEKNQIRHYAISIALIVVLFTPHFSVTLHQLQSAGLQWLGKPTPAFFIAHLYEIFNHSWLWFILIFIFILNGFFASLKYKIPIPQKQIIVAIILFLTPLFVGYFYSVTRSPVLQHSVLLFSMPPLMLIVGYFCSIIPMRIFHLQSMIVISSGILLIVYGRKHYSVVSKEAYSSAVRYMVKDTQSVFLVDAPKDIFEYYLEKYDPENKIHFEYLDFRNRAQFIQKISDFQNNKIYPRFLLSSGSDPAIIPLLEELFNSKKCSHLETSWIGAEIPFFHYKGHNLKYFIIERFNLEYRYKPIDMHLYSLHPEQNDVVVVKYLKNTSDSISGELQCNLRNGNTYIDWRSEKLRNDSGYLNELVILPLKLADIPSWKPDSKLTIKLESAYQRGVLNVSLVKGNPYLYGVPD